MNKALRNTLICLVAFFGTLSIAYWQRQNILDWYKLSSYTAPSSISSLAQQDTFTPYATRLFYINHPVLISGSNFRTQCPNSDPANSEILGCYHPIMNGIYLYIVSDSTLNGVEQVTAAHEMLHAAWARLPSSEKAKLTSELNNYYNNELTDPEIRNEIAIYQQTEPGSVADEMHSTFGTECQNLPPELENYYKQLFTNRQTVVGFANSYKSVFQNYQNQIKGFDSQLSSLKTTINSNITTLKSEQNALSSLKSQMNSLFASGQISQYNQDVLSYNQQVNSYNNLITATQSLISEYNSTVASRNSVASIFDSLSEQLNSNLTQLPTR
jgi:hypothetical protein